MLSSTLKKRYSRIRLYVINGCGDLTLGILYLSNRLRMQNENFFEAIGSTTYYWGWRMVLKLRYELVQVMEGTSFVSQWLLSP